MRPHAVLIALALTVAASAAKAAECMQDNAGDQIAEGRLDSKMRPDAQSRPLSSGCRCPLASTAVTRIPQS